MQKLDLDYMSSLPDYESLSQYLQTLPVSTLHLFSPDSRDFQTESLLIESNFETVISFLLSFISKTEAQLLQSSHEIFEIQKELETTKQSLEHSQLLVKDYSHWNRRLEERTQLLITQNQEMEQKQHSLELKIHEKGRESAKERPAAKSVAFISHIEEDSAFLQDFFQKKKNSDFTNKFFTCKCSGKLKKFQSAIEDLENEVEELKASKQALLVENGSLKNQNEQLEKRLECVIFDLRKSQLELGKLDEKRKIYETFKFNFLTSSARPVMELEIQSATKASRSSNPSKFPRNKKKTMSKGTHSGFYSESNSQHSMTLLTDIERTMGTPNDFFEEEFTRLICCESRKKRLHSWEEVRSPEKEIYPKKVIKKKKSMALNPRFVDMLMFLLLTVLGLFSKIKKIDLRIHRLVTLLPRVALFLIFLYWMSMFKLISSLFDVIYETRVWKLPFLVLRKMRGE